MQNIQPQPTLVVRGLAGYLVVPIVAIPALAVGAFGYYRDHLPEFCIENAEKVIGIALALTAVLVVAALFLRARRLEVRGGQLRYRSWLTDRTLPAASISAVTFETEVSGGPDNANVQHYLSLWSGERVVLKFNSVLWRRAELARLLRWLNDTVPGIRLDLAVERYMRRAG